METALPPFYKDILDHIEQRDIPSRSTELHLRKVFRYYDTEDTSTIDKENFKRVMQRLGLAITPQRQQTIDSCVFGRQKYINYLHFVDDVLKTKAGAEDTLTVYTSKDYHKSLKALQKQAASTSLLLLLKAFVAADVEKTQCLSLALLSKIAEDNGFKGLKEDIAVIMDTLDRRLDNKINYLDFLYLLVTELKPARAAMLEEVFDKIAIGGKVPFYSIASKWNLANHPDVKNHVKNFKDIETEFNDGLKAFAMINKLNSLDLQHFKEFMTFVSSPIDSDNYFKLVIERIFVLKLADHAELRSTKTVSADEEISQKLQALSKRYKNVRSDVVDKSIYELVKALKERGVLSFLGFLRYLTVQDKLKAGHINFAAFKQALIDYRVPVHSDNISNIFKYFQKNTYGEFIRLSELEETLVAPLSEEREKIVSFCFDKLTQGKSDRLEIDAVNKLTKDYSTNDPSLLSFSSSSDLVEALQLHQDLQGSKQSYITKAQFLNFYRYISVFIDGDRDFEHYVLNSWRIFGDKSCSDQVSTRSNLSSHSRLQNAPYDVYPNNQGNQYIGAKSIDRSQLSVKLRTQGIAAGKESSYNHNSKSFAKKEGFIGDADRLLMKIRQQGGQNFINLEDRLLAEDIYKKGEVGVKPFCNMVTTFYKGKLSAQEIEDLASLYSSKNKLVNYRRFISDVAKPFDPALSQLLNELFDAADIYKIGVVVFEVIKNRFKASQHPLVTNNQKEDYQVHQEFIGCLEGFCRTFKMRNHRNTYELNFQEFERFFQYYLLNADDENLRTEIIKKCFKI